MQTKSSCYFFSWNLGANTKPEVATQAFKLAVEHFATQGTFIAALQEVPKESAKLVAELSDYRVRVVEKTVGAKVMLLHSRDLRVLGTETFDRLSGAAFAGDVWGDLQVLGIHIESRVRGNIQSRQEAIRTNIGEFANLWRGGPLVLLGDFNANPYDMELCAPECAFNALRDRDIIHWTKIPTKSAQGLRFPLYNPMWYHLQEKNIQSLNQEKSTDSFTANENDSDNNELEARGTNQFATNFGGLRSQVYDQILISKHLMDKIVDGPHILSKIEGRMLITRRDGRGPGGYPTSIFTDHLPVTIKIDVSNR